jgi:hypothetical protein
MRKIVFLPGRTDWHHIADFHFCSRHQHTVDEQFDQLPLLLKAGLLESLPDPLAEALDRLCQPRQLVLPVRVLVQLPLLLVQSLLPLLSIGSSTPVFFERSDATQIRLRQTISLL